MTDRDRQRIATLHPVLQERITTVLAAIEILGFEMTVTSAKRTEAEQTKLYLQGRNGNPGPIVTNANGTTSKSRHQSGRAVDCVFLVEGVPSWDLKLPWKAYGYAGMALGLVWGGLWRSPYDPPHLELPQEIA